MEQPFKRRRVSRRGEQRIGESNPEDDLWLQWKNHDLVKEKSLGSSGGFDGPNYPLNGSKATRRASIPGNDGDFRLHPRNLIHRRNSDSPTNTAVVSLIQVVVHSGDATPTNVFVPAESSVFSLPGFGPVTLKNPAPSASPAPSPAPSVLNPGISASNQQAPQSTQSASFSQAVPSSQLSVPPSQAIQPHEYAASSAASSAAPTRSTSMTINLQGISSQQVISPSPSSPLPPSPASSESSGSITGSFFPSSASSSQSSAGETLPSQESQPPPKTNIFVPPTNGNFSISSLATTKSSATTLPTSLRTTRSASKSKHSTSTTSPSRTSFQTSTRSSTRSRSSLPSSLETSTSFVTSQSSQTQFSNPTITPGGGAVGGIGGASGTSNGLSSSATAGAGSGGNDNTPSTPVVVGGVVGGLAGLSIILVMVLFLLRWRRKKAQRQTTFSPLPQTLPPGDASLGGTVTERSSAVPLTTAGFFKRLRPNSGQTAATTDTAPSERGFQNFGGRKLESVLSSRGDGYGEPGPSSAQGASAGLGSAAGVPRSQGFGHSPGPSEQETLSGSSFYRDDQGFYGGKSSPSSMIARGDSPSTTSPSYPPPVGAGLPPESIGEYSRRSEVAFMRPGPARTPVTNQPGFTPMRNPPRPPRTTPSPRPGSSSTPRPSGSSSTPRPPGSQSPLTVPMTGFPRPPDELGRSHPSFDGSRGSRFTEEV